MRMLLQQLQTLTQITCLQQRRSGVNAASEIEGRQLLQCVHDDRRSAGEIIGKFRRAHERYLRTVRPRDVGNFGIVGADHDLLEQT